MGATKKLGRWPRYLLLFARAVGMGLFFAVVTGFVFLNSFEIVFNRDVPFVEALVPFHSPDTIRSVSGDNPAASLISDVSRDRAGDFGLPKTLKIPAFGSRLPLSKALFVDGSWLARSGIGHFMIIGPGRNGNIGDMVVYVRKGWRTLSDPERLLIGDNIFVETDSDWRYMFRVSNKSLLRINQPFVKSENDLGSLILFIEDEDRNAVFAFEGVLASVQNIRQ